MQGILHNNSFRASENQSSPEACGTGGPNNMKDPTFLSLFSHGINAVLFFRNAAFQNEISKYLNFDGWARQVLYVKISKFDSPLSKLA